MKLLVRVKWLVIGHVVLDGDDTLLVSLDLLVQVIRLELCQD